MNLNPIQNSSSLYIFSLITLKLQLIKKSKMGSICADYHILTDIHIYDNDWTGKIKKNILRDSSDQERI